MGSSRLITAFITMSAILLIASCSTQKENNKIQVTTLRYDIGLSLQL